MLLAPTMECDGRRLGEECQQQHFLSFSAQRLLMLSELLLCSLCNVLGIHEGRCRRALCACGVGEQVRIPWRAPGRSGRRLVRFRAEASRKAGRGCALGVSLEGLARTTASFWQANDQARAGAVRKGQREVLRWDVLLLSCGEATNGEMRDESRCGRIHARGSICCIGQHQLPLLLSPRITASHHHTRHDTAQAQHSDTAHSRTKP